MVSLLILRSRSIFLFAWYLIILFVCSASAFGQTPQIVLGTQNVQASLDTDNSQEAEAFPVTANSRQPRRLTPFHCFSTAQVLQPQCGSVSTQITPCDTRITLLKPSCSHATLVWQMELRQHSLGTSEDGETVLGCLARVERPNCISRQHRQLLFRNKPTNKFDFIAIDLANWLAMVDLRRLDVRSSAAYVSNVSSVSVSVSPTTASLQVSQQMQFTATMSGTTNTAVTWTASGGTVTSGGIYTAPSSAGTYTVTATSAADSTKSTSAVVTVSHPVQVSVLNFTNYGDPVQWSAKTIHGVGFGVNQYRGDLGRFRWHCNRRWFKPYTSPVVGGNLHGDCHQRSRFHQIGLRCRHSVAARSSLCLNFTNYGDPVNRGAKAIYGVGVGVNHYRGDLDRFRWDCDQQWHVHRAILGGDLHRNGHQRGRLNQISLRYRHSVTDHCSVDFNFAEHGELVDWWTRAIYRQCIGDQQYGGDLVCIRRYS